MPTNKMLSCKSNNVWSFVYLFIFQNSEWWISTKALSLRRWRTENGQVAKMTGRKRARTTTDDDAVAVDADRGGSAGGAKWPRGHSAKSVRHTTVRVRWHSVTGPVRVPENASRIAGINKWSCNGAKVVKYIIIYVKILWSLLTSINHIVIRENRRAVVWKRYYMTENLVEETFSCVFSPAGTGAVFSPPDYVFFPLVV